MKKLLVLLMMIAFNHLNSNAQGLNLPYYTGFDSPAERAGWQQFRTGVIGSYDWSDNGQISHDYNVGANATDTLIDWYVSPAFDFTAPGQISMKLRSFGFSPDPIPDACEVYYSTSDPDPTTSNYTLIGNLSYTPSDNTWRDTLFNVPVTDDNVYIAFKYKTIGAHWRVYSIDSITVSLDPSTSILEKEIASDFIKVSPNPANEFINLALTQKLTNANLYLLNSNGQLVKEYKNISGSTLNLPINEIPNGLYFLNITQENTRLKTSKIIIHHP